MNDNTPPIDWADRAIGLGAGLAGALLFAASLRGGSGLGVLFAYLAPLPLMIGALGFSAPGALVGALLGALLLAEIALPAVGLAFLFGFALPALTVSALASRNFARASDETPPFPRYLRPGALLAVILLFSVAATCLGVLALIDHHGGFDQAVAALETQFAPLLDEVATRLRAMDGELDAGEIKRLMILSAPAGATAWEILLFALNFWLAARAVDISGRLGRPWPPIPENLVLPRLLAPAFVISLGLAASGGVPGLMAGAFAAGTGFCFALQGLAALHAFSRERAWRAPMLTSIYAALFGVWPWSLFVLTAFGLVESVFSLRARRARRLFVKLEKTQE
jgi:hypothetical protein